MEQADNEINRLISHIIAVYEVFFGFILAGGIPAPESAYPLMRGAAGFFLAGVGLHYFVNIKGVDKKEFARKSGRLWVGLIALFIGIASVTFIDPDNAFSSYFFFLVFILYIVVAFLYFAAFKNVFLAGSFFYGSMRVLPVLAGAVIQGRVIPADFSSTELYMLIFYGMFHFFSDFLRRSGFRKSTRLSLLTGFLGLLILMAGMFYHISIIIDSTMKKAAAMFFILLCIILVSIPPLKSIRSMKADDLLPIFPRSIAGGALLSIMFCIILTGNFTYVWLTAVPVIILAVHYKQTTSQEKEKNGI